MKKIICLFALLFLVTGCSNIDKLSYDEITDSILGSSSKEANEALVGYKIYIPVGMSLINDNSNNNTLYSNGDKYYLYADVISYYKKQEVSINEDKNAYFYKKLSYNDKTGYLLITKKDDAYFIQVYYNYAKIEVVTNDVKNSVIKSLVILNSLSYNDYVVESLVGSNVLNYGEEEYSLSGPAVSNTNDFLQYEEDYSYTEPEKVIDNDNIDISDNNEN